MVPQAENAWAAVRIQTFFREPVACVMPVLAFFMEIVYPCTTMVSEARPEHPDDDLDSTIELPGLDMESDAPDEIGGDNGEEVTLIQPRLAANYGNDEFAEFESEIVALSADVERLRTLLLERDSQVEAAGVRVDAAEERVARVLAAQQALQNQLAASQAEVAVAREERTTLWGKLEFLEGELRASSALTDELNATAQGQSAQQQTFAARIEAAERTAQWAQKDAAALAGQVSALQEALQSREARRVLWESMLRETDAALAASSASGGQLSTDLSQAQTRVADLEAKLAAAEARGEEARTATAAESSRADGLAARIAELESQLASRGAERDAAEQRGAQLESDLEAARAAAASLREQLQSAELRATEAAASHEARAAEAAAANEALQSRVAEIERSAAARITAVETALRFAEKRAHQLEVELNLKIARLGAMTAVESASSASATATRRLIESSLQSARTPEEIAERAATATAQASSSPQGEASPPVSDVVRRDPELLPDGAPRYLILSDGNADTVFRLGRRTTIGRAEDNDICIPRTSISRHHAVIVSGPRQTTIEDLQSTNGIAVNRKRVRQSVLRDGDIVHVGKSKFRYSDKVRTPGKT